MTWNSVVEAEYDALLAGVMGDALGGSATERQLLKSHLALIESGSASGHNPVPTNGSRMTQSQAQNLWLVRAAYAFYMERNTWWPWRLRDKTVEELRPLLNFGWQGFVRIRVGKNQFEFGMHGVWDDRPALRAAEALLGWFFLNLAGIHIETEVELVSHIVQALRDGGWHHVLGLWEDYEGFPRHGSFGTPTFAFDDVATLRAGECHINANFLTARLRSFNVPAHMGPGWTTLPGGGKTLLPEDSFAAKHAHGHCFLHFPTLSSWFAHGDDIQNRLLKSFAPILALRSEFWAHAYLLQGTQYEWTRAQDFDDHSWWCLVIGRSPEDLQFDVPFLFQANQLRTRLENVHLDNRYAQRAGAPAVVPPLFEPWYVDTLMDWVASKLG